MLKTYIQDDIYGNDITLCADCSLEDYKKELAKSFGDTDFSDMDGGDANVTEIECAGQRFNLMWFEEIDQSALICHEIVHHVFNTFVLCGIPTTKENDEAFAYYYQYIINKVLLALNNYQEKQTKKLKPKNGKRKRITK